MKYNIIYADPPWHLKRGPMWSKGGTSQPLPYPTMTIDEIAALNVSEIAAEDSHLYLWTVNKYIKESFIIVKSWGFTFSCMITWCKNPYGLGLGGQFAQTTEHLLFCRRGHLPCAKRMNSTWYLKKRGAHSVKPQFFRDLIIESSGDLPRVELFARQKTDGWDIWGNELPNDIELMAS